MVEGVCTVRSTSREPRGDPDAGVVAVWRSQFPKKKSMAQSDTAMAAGAWSTVRPPLSEWMYVRNSHRLDVVASMEYTQMTPVQAASIPLFLSHKDVVAEAVTGSGKTLAFVIPILEILRRREVALKRHDLGAVIVCPTRELAEQTCGVLQHFLDAQPDETAPHGRVGPVQLVVGGLKVSPAEDYRLFRENGPDILVGTPGRMEELLKKPGVRTSELDVLVMDEADRLLDLGFVEPIRALLAYLPKQRRTGLFSATMTEALTELVRVGLRNPVRVVVKVETKAKGSATRKDIRMPATLHNFYHVSRPENKLAQLLRLLRREAQDGAHKAIVYFATCAQVNYVFSLLSQHTKMHPHDTKGLQFFSLHGKQTTKRRHATFQAFAHAHTDARDTDRTGASDAQCTVLLCTDVAARGLDLPDVDVVIQYDPPNDPKVFSHRCGRTARAGRTGRAIVLLHEGREEGYVGTYAPLTQNTCRSSRCHCARCVMSCQRSRTATSRQRMTMPERSSDRCARRCAVTARCTNWECVRL